MYQKNILKYYVIGFLVFSFFIIVPKVDAAQVKPPTSTTWYVNISENEKGSTLNNWMYYKGYDQGKGDLSSSSTQPSTVILDFGQPWVSGGLQGTTGFAGSYVFLSTAEIYDAARYFTSGYYYGSNNGSKIIRLAIGTNNQNSAGTVTYAHGQAWAQLINDLNAWVKGTVANGKVFMYGANDIEPSYSTSNAAYNWVNGYTSKWIAPSYLLNYGAADGCKLSGTISSPGSCNNNWTQEHVYYMSWGALPAYPLPEIYTTTGSQSKQWQQLSLYSYLAHGSRMDVVGSLSQSQACNQRGGCVGTNNNPDNAWTQLWNALNGDSRTAQNMSFSSDISWRK